MVFGCPCNRHVAARHSQSAILSSIGRKLVDCQGQSEGLSRFDNKWRTRGRKPALAYPVRGQGSADHIMEGCCSPICRGKQVVRSSERSKSCLILLEIGFARYVAKCLGRHGTEYCESILDPVR